MRLPERALTTTVQVLAQVKGPADGLGQSVTTWQVTGEPIRAAQFPAGERTLRLAQLRAVKVNREVYLQGSINLSPQTHRLRLDGADYVITLVNEWDGFTVCGVVS